MLIVHRINTTEFEQVAVEVVSILPILGGLDDSVIRHTDENGGNILRGRHGKWKREVCKYRYTCTTYLYLIALALRIRLRSVLT